MHFTTLTLLLAQIAAILLVSRALGLVARAVGQPLVIAEMIAGILLGPSLLGLLWPHGYATLFPESSLPVLQLLSQLGLVLFMFLVGLELDPTLLRGRQRASVLISHCSLRRCDRPVSSRGGRTSFTIALVVVPALTSSTRHSSP